MSDSPVSRLSASRTGEAGGVGAALAELGRDDIAIVLGGVVPEQDHDALREAGVLAIFGPGTVIAEAAIDVVERLERRDA